MKLIDKKFMVELYNETQRLLEIEDFDTDRIWNIILVDIWVRIEVVLGIVFTYQGTIRRSWFDEVS